MRYFELPRVYQKRGFFFSAVSYFFRFYTSVGKYRDVVIDGVSMMAEARKDGGPLLEALVPGMGYLVRREGNFFGGEGREERGEVSLRGRPVVADGSSGTRKRA